MVKILEHIELGGPNRLIVFDVPMLVKKAQAGQFVILRVTETGERIPMSIGDLDRDKGTLTVVYQVIGKTTMELSLKKAGEEICDVVGPLGVPTHFPESGTFVGVGGGIGIAPIHNICDEAKSRRLHVIGIMGARTKDLLFFEDRMREVTDELIVCTDDGSYAIKGFVTDPLKKLHEDGVRMDHIMAIGPVPMMKFLAATTRPWGIPTWVSLNPIMVDGTGMCGGCRVTIGGKTKFACVDGPDFDGHQVDFDELTKRLSMYKDQERRAVEIFQQHHPECVLQV